MWESGKNRKQAIEFKAFEAPFTLTRFHYKTHWHISMRFGLPFTLIRWAFSLKKGPIWKRSWKWVKTKTHTYRLRVDGRKRITMKTVTENIAGTGVCSMRIELNVRHKVWFYRFRTFYGGLLKPHQNDSVGANGSKRFRWQRNLLVYFWKHISVDESWTLNNSELSQATIRCSGCYK